jgi:hypothetical protein
MVVSMTQDEIIKMAKQAKAIPIHKDFNQLALIGTENIEAFAKLVTQNDQKEIERLRALCHEMLSELYVYRASKHLKDVTATIRARGQA